MYVYAQCKVHAQANTVADTENAGTPPSSQSSPQQNPAFYSQRNGLSDDEQDDGIKAPVAPKKGGYDGRIQQILYENPDLEITIAEAGKSPDGNFIAYRIRTDVRIEGGQER